MAGLKITGWRLLALVACAVLAVSAAVAAVVVGTTAASPARPQTQAASAGPQISVSLQAATAARTTAARWIAGQVSPSAIVACDPAMCAALQASGVAAGRLLVLGTSASDPLGSDLVVATPALRSQFGARLASVYAPVVIASFGSGAAADRHPRGRRRRDRGLRLRPGGRPQRQDRGGRAAHRQPSHRHDGGGGDRAAGRAGRPAAAGHAGRAGRPAAAADTRLRRSVAGRERGHPAPQRRTRPGRRPGPRPQPGCGQCSRSCRRSGRRSCRPRQHSFTSPR